MNATFITAYLTFLFLRKASKVVVLPLPCRIVAKWKAFWQLVFPVVVMTSSSFDMFFYFYLKACLQLVLPNLCVQFPREVQMGSIAIHSFSITDWVWGSIHSDATAYTSIPSKEEISYICERPSTVFFSYHVRNANVFSIGILFIHLFWFYSITKYESFYILVAYVVNLWAWNTIVLKNAVLPNLNLALFVPPLCL